MTQDDKIRNDGIRPGDMLFGTYRIEPEVFQGGFGKVWRVHHTGWNVDLAMKQPLAEKFQDERQKADFVAECDKWINLGLHPHIVSCYYVREINGVPTTFAEWLEGGTLKDWIGGRLYDGDEADQLERVLDIAIQFAWGLGYAQARGLIHRDVKPENLLLTSGGVAKVSDFGIASAGSGSGSVHQYHTPAYSSPEQSMGQPQDETTDVYSWALSVLEMFMGPRPWASGVAVGYAPDDYFAMPMRVPMPPEMEDLLRICLTADAEERGALLKIGLPADPEGRDAFFGISQKLLEIYQDVIGSAYPRPKSKAASDTADSLNNHALSFLDIGKPAEAEACWKQAQQVENSHLETAYNYGLHLWRTAQIIDEEALFMVQRATDGNSWKSRYLTGLLHMERDDLPSALACMEEAQKLNPGQPEVAEALKTLRNTKIENLLIAEFDNSGHRSHHDLSPDGRLLTLTESSKSTGSEILGLYDLFAKERLCEYPSSMMLEKRIFFHPNGQSLFIKQGDVLTHWDTGGQQLKSYELPSDSQFLPMALSSDFESMIVFDYYTNNVEAMDLKTGEKRTVIDNMPHTGDLLMGPGDDSFFSVTNDNDNGRHDLALRDLTAGRSIRTFTGHTDYIRLRQTKISPDRKYLLTSSNDGTVRLWDIETGVCLLVFTLIKYYYDAVFHPNSKRILVANNNTTLLLLELPTGRCLRSIKVKDRATLVRIMPDGQSLVAAGSATETPIAHLRMPNPIFKADWSLCHITDTARRSAEEELFERHVVQAESLLAAGDINGGLAELEQALAVPGYANNERCLAIKRETAKYCRVKTLKSCNILKTFPAQLYLLDVSIDGRYGLFENCMDKNATFLELHDLDTGMVIQHIIDDYYMHDIYAFTPNGQLVEIDKDFKQKHPDIENLPPLPKGPAFSRHYRKAYSHCETYYQKLDCNSICAFHPNGKQMILLNARDNQARIVFTSIAPVSNQNDSDSAPPETASERRFKLDPLIDGQPLMSNRPLSEVLFWPNARYLLCYARSHGADHLNLFELETGRRLQSYEIKPDPDYYGHFLALSPNGRYIAVGGKKIWLYDINDPKPKYELCELFEESRYMYKPTFLYDGGILMSCTSKTMSFWRVDTGECLFTRQGDYPGANGMLFSNDNCRLFANRNVFALEWEYEFPGWTDWDEAALPYLENFLAFNPDYTDGDFDLLIEELQARGLGYIRPQGLRAKLDELQFGW